MSTVITTTGPRERLTRLIRPPRVNGLDVARALAVLGMLGAHVGNAGYVQWNDPGTWIGIVNGNSAILFALLAGVSIGIVTGGTTRPERADMPRLRLRMIGRGAVIFLIGLVLENLGSGVAVILCVYGVLYAAMIPTLRLRRRTLLILALAIAVLGPLTLRAVLLLSLDPGGSGSSLVLGLYPATTWLPLMMTGLAIGRTDLRRPRTALILAGIGSALVLVVTLLSLLLTPLVIPDGSSAGQLVDASGSSSGSAAASGGSAWAAGSPTDPQDIDFTGLTCIPPDEDGVVICGGPEIFGEASDSSGSSASGSSGSTGEDAGGVHETWPEYPENLAEQQPVPALILAVVDTSPHSGGTLETLGSGGLALLVLGACLLVGPPLRWVLLPLSALGSMPLTAYALHVVAIVLIAGPGGWITSNLWWAGIALALIVLCTAWAALWGRGPLERLVAAGARAAARV